MRETQFIQQNEAKWREFEEELQDGNATKDAEKLSEMYIQIMDDLSHAHTFYPSRSVRLYLNGLAQLITSYLHKRRTANFQRITVFFTDELPLVVYESRRIFWLATLLFLLATFIGYFSSMMDEKFPVYMLGEGYVEMTRENIESGDPMAVYKQTGMVDMTLGIMLNNLYVTFRYFILGIFAGIGSAASMMFEGVRIGAFLQFFSRSGLFAEANLTIWMHGTLEIAAIIIGTAAGMVMGSGWLFPGTLTRLQSFQLSARRGIKIMMGVVVMLILAAIIEGCLTRFTEAGTPFRATFIGFWLIAIVTYYGWYPFYKAKQGTNKNIKEYELPPDARFSINYFEIKTAGVLFAETFWLMKTHLSRLMKVSFLGAIIYCSLVYTIFNNVSYDRPFHQVFYLGTYFLNQHEAIAEFFINSNIKYLFIYNSFVFSTLAFLTYRILYRDEPQSKPKSMAQWFIAWLQMVIVQLPMFWLCSQHESWLFLISFFALPFFSLMMMLIMRDGFNVFSAIRHTFWLLGSGFGKAIGLNILMALITWLFYGLVTSSIFWLYFRIIGWNFKLTEENIDAFSSISLAFIAVFGLFLLMQVIYFSMGLLYYALLEVNEAKSLVERIQKIGMGRKIRGMSRE